MILLALSLAGVASLSPAAPARQDSVELRSRAGSLGRIARVVVDDGAGYVAADRLAAVLKGSWSATGNRATLTVSNKTAQFVKDQARVVFAGQSLVLDAPVLSGPRGWLLPEEFLVKGVPRLVPGVTAAVPEPRKAATAPEARKAAVTAAGADSRKSATVAGAPQAAKSTAVATLPEPRPEPGKGTAAATVTESRKSAAVAAVPGSPKAAAIAAPPEPRKTAAIVAVPESPKTGAIATVPEPVRSAVQPARSAIGFQELRYRSYPSFTRIVVETKGLLTYTITSGSDEILVRLPRLGMEGARTEAIADGLVREVRLEPEASEAVLRIGLESAAADVKASTLQEPFRLMLDVYRPRMPGGRAGRPDLEPLRLIVLDAGHGGHDPGATGPTGVMEKDVTLDVIKRVARLVDEELGVKVALTRSTDVFVPLRERTNFANKQRADLFVSVHANAHPNAVSEGVETYFLSSEASDSNARQVAAAENGVVRLESPASRAKGDVLKSILWDLAQSEFQQESSYMAETVQDSMTRSLNLFNRGIKQAGFYVLGGAAMPAILIEIGFLTNRNEERKLATPDYREAVARAIYTGLADYKRRHDQRVRTAQTLPLRAERAR